MVIGGTQRVVPCASTTRPRPLAVCNTYLNQVFALSLCDQWLQFGSGKRVDQTGLGYDQEENLGSGKDGQFVGLEKPTHVSRKGRAWLAAQAEQSASWQCLREMNDSVGNVASSRPGNGQCARGESPAWDEDVTKKSLFGLNEPSS